MTLDKPGFWTTLCFLVSLGHRNNLRKICGRTMGRGCFRAGLYVCGWTWSTMSPSPQCCSSNSALFTLDRPGRWTTLCVLQATENLRKPLCGRCVKFHREQSCMCAYGQQVNGGHNELLNPKCCSAQTAPSLETLDWLNFSVLNPQCCSAQTLSSLPGDAGLAWTLHRPCCPTLGANVTMMQ